ncbi:MAG: hypothetical protein ACI8P3_000867 [Saprospiraceae bacterium]|jgi:hypothetical protein
MEEPKNMDVLFSIENAIVVVYKDNPQMKDIDTIKALEALINYYRAKITGKELQTPVLGEYAPLVYNGVLSALVLYLMILGEASIAPKPKRFSSAFKELTQDEIILAALRKIEKSSKRWNQRNGEQGYLNFISVHLPG